ncbi:MAG: hypothetical protein ACD_23C00778G0002 [uncultured bacterium]|nr:MAG: hypothetical protein ACD_23C00778G0002 [uncultured bacterium]
MDHATEIEALLTVLHTVMDGHPDPDLAVAQVDALIADLKLDTTDPLRVAVENIRATLV